MYDSCNRYVSAVRQYKGGVMIKQSENRKYERYTCQAPIMIYNKDASDDYYYGLTYNYSQGGMYVKTDGDLEAEEYYVIKMLNYDDTAAGPEKYQEYRGLVRWAQLPDSPGGGDSNYYYGYGVEFTRPVVY